MTTIDLSAGTIHYREYGPTDGPAVVFVHGFLVDGTLWGRTPELMAARGFRTFVPTWPLGSHTHPMRDDASLAPRDVARLVLDFLETLDLDDVTLVGNDTGGAISQFAIDEDPTRIGRLVLTNCDAFEVFPPFPFDQLFRLARHPGAARAALVAARLGWVRNSPLAFGWLTRRKLTAAESAPWVAPYLDDKQIRNDTARFMRGWDPKDLLDVGTRLGRFDKPVLLCWGMADRFFKPSLAARLQEAFPDARLVEFPGARTFLPLDEPERLAEEISAFAAVAAR